MNTTLTPAEELAVGDAFLLQTNIDVDTATVTSVRRHEADPYAYDDFRGAAAYVTLTFTTVGWDGATATYKTIERWRQFPTDKKLHVVGTVA